MLASGPLYSPLDMYFRAVDGHEAWLKWKAEQQQEQQRQYMAGVR
jgi:hypothetical protein